MNEMESIVDLIDDAPTFDLFWKEYPRKTDKAKSVEAFAKLSPADQWSAIRGAEYHTKSNPQWRNPKLIPHATTFLNRKRWDDEIVEERDAKDRVHNHIDTSNAMMVWKAMTQMFGTGWINKHGESPMPVWVTQLHHLSDTQIKKGLRECADSGTEFAPSLPAFIAMCRRQTDNLPAYQSLPRPWGNEAVADEAFDELRAILRYKI
jgi:hypothetical protein